MWDKLFEFHPQHLQPPYQSLYIFDIAFEVHQVTIEPLAMSNLCQFLCILPSLFFILQQCFDPLCPLIPLEYERTKHLDSMLVCDCRHAWRGEGEHIVAKEGHPWVRLNQCLHRYPCQGFRTCKQKDHIQGGETLFTRQPLLCSAGQVRLPRARRFHYLLTQPRSMFPRENPLRANSRASPVIIYGASIAILLSLFLLQPKQTKMSMYAQWLKRYQFF